MKCFWEGWKNEVVTDKARSQTEIRPLFHWTPSRVRGHIFICFLAFLLTVSLQRRLSEIGVKESVCKVIRDVQKIKAVKLYIKEEAYLVRTELKGLAHKAFRAVSLKVPPQVQKLWIFQSLKK